MSDANIFTIAMSVVTMLVTVVSVWAFTRKNQSEVFKAKALGEVRANDADIKERADLIEMIKESGKNSVVWLETLKITEHKRELDYATLKAIIEDGTKETINSRKELAAQAEKHSTGMTNRLEELQREFAAIKSVIGSLPEGNSEIKARLDRLLSYVERLLPKLKDTRELPTVTLPPGITTVEITTPPPANPS